MAWRRLCASHPSVYPENWAEEGRPFVVRRPLAEDRPGAVPLGLPLPPGEGKLRLNICIDDAAIIKVEPMPRLDAASKVAPIAWHAAISQVLEFAPSVRVFGSLAWEYLTGLRYVTVASDLDFLFELPSMPETWDRLIMRLTALDQKFPGLVDGECVRSDGTAAKWRELAGDAEEILVKDLHTVTLMKRTHFFQNTVSPAA